MNDFGKRTRNTSKTIKWLNILNSLSLILLHLLRSIITLSIRHVTKAKIILRSTYKVVKYSQKSCLIERNKARTPWKSKRETAHHPLVPTAINNPIQVSLSIQLSFIFTFYMIKYNHNTKWLVTRIKTINIPIMQKEFLRFFIFTIFFLH